MSNISENTEDIMDDTSIELNANSKENEDDDHVKLQKKQHLEQSSIEDANQDVLSISSEDITTSNPTPTDAKGESSLRWSHEHGGRSSSALHRAAAAARVSFLQLHSPDDLSSILSKREEMIDDTSIKFGANTNETNKKTFDSNLQEDTNSKDSTLEKEEQNVSTINKEKIISPEKVTSKSATVMREQLLCNLNLCSDSDTEVSFKAESKEEIANNSKNAEDMRNDVSRKCEKTWEEKNESDVNDKLNEDGKSRHSPVKSQQNDSNICIEQKSSPENIATKSKSTKGNPLLCSAYSDSNSDSESSLKDDDKGIFCSMYSDSESEESIEKEKNEKDFIHEQQSHGSGKSSLKYEPKNLKDFPNTDTDLKTLSTETELNNKEANNHINLESSLSALTNEKVELEHSKEDQEVQNQNFNIIKNLGDSCSEPIYKHESDNISSEMQDLSKNVDKDIDMSVLFEPNEDSRSSSFTTQTEEKCDNNVTEQLYKEFSKIIEDENKESIVPEYVTENRIVKTISPNLDNIIFREFSINLSNLESTLGCKPVEMLQDIDVSLTEWATLLVSQLSIRDELISTLYSSIEKLVQRGTTLEQDLDYQQIKITELKQQVKKKKRKHKHKLCQTDPEEHLNSWNEYYEAYPHSYDQYFYQNNQWPADYGAKTSVVNSSVAQPSSKKKVSVVRDHKDDKVVKEYKDFMKNVKNDISVKGVTKDSFRNDPSVELDVKSEENAVKDQDDSNDKDQMASETKETTEIDIIQTKNTSISKSTSAVNSSVSGNKSDEIIQTLMDETEDQQTDDSNSQTVTEDVTESDSHGWDSSKSISDQVVAAASQIVEGSGYVFDQESGLYYDHNSGYYYNAETGLYYDSNSGTYFYYDHTTQAYQFHSQVTPENYENTPKSGNKRKIKSLEEAHKPLKKKKCKIENETNGEKEDGECSESEEFSDGLDGVYGLNELSNEESEEEMEKENEEVAISQSEVPPSLRLMVIQSEAKRVSVGSLQMVTVDGGTAGREPNNIVHLQDISVSKVHARFIFRSNGPTDFHYYVQDLGSNNGTFVNAMRLSEPRQESQEKELGHGWLLRLGQVTLKCHIHPGTLTCNECEPGLVAKVNKKKEGSGYKSVKSREKARKKEMKAIKKKYALSYTDQSSLLGSEYKDRAENRRLVVGSDNPYEKTEVASTETALTSKNKGFKMLEKMGWTEGHGIGKTTGLIEPIQAESSVGRSGLGSMVTPVPETTSDQANRKKISAITQKRYNKL